MDDKEPLPFLPRVMPKPQLLPPDEEPEETIAPGNAFAVARGLRAPATLRFLHADGSLMFALAYGHLPTVWGDLPGAILLEYPNFGSIILPGKNLTLLEARLCEYRVTWIRECTDAEAALLDTAVTRIERMRRYPSREADGGGSDR